jgi:hypothetical protein
MIYLQKVGIPLKAIPDSAGKPIGGIGAKRSWVSKSVREVTGFVKARSTLGTLRSAPGEEFSKQLSLPWGRARPDCPNGDRALDRSSLTA